VSHARTSVRVSSATRSCSARIRSNAMAAAIVAALLASPFASAVPILQVDSTADLVDDDPSDGVCHTAAGTCTLRAAVMQANSFAVNGALVIVPAGTYTLTRPVFGGDDASEGDLNLDATSGAGVTTISGAGSTTTVIDGNQIDRIFNVGSGRHVVIEGVTIRNGLSGLGGCVGNGGVLTLQDSTITNCYSQTYGGGIDNVGMLAVIDSTISSSQAPMGDGGAISNDGTLQLIRSTLEGNQASSGGGLSDALGSSITINSTIAGNAADHGAGVFMYADGSATFYNTTISSNFVPLTQTESYGAAGVGALNASSVNVALYNSLVANNVDQYSRGDFDCDGTLDIQQQNILGVAPVCDEQGCQATGIEGCTLVGGGQSTQLDSAGTLGGLASNGGPTRTIALLPGSNAIDYGDPVSGCLDDNGRPLSIDQRGFARPAGVACDMGAFEAGADNPDDEIFGSGFE
jgi:CSLREA domain-containing protein